jgi:hypothetical protein
METLLAFFADLILFTAGLAVAFGWLAIFVAIIVEVMDNHDERKALKAIRDKGWDEED